MDQELRLFRDLMFAVWDHHRKPWLYPRGQAKDIFRNIAKTYPSLSDRRELELSLPYEDKVEASFLPNKYMYLNPITRGQVLLPVIKLKKCDFGRSIPEIRIKLGLFVQHDGDIKYSGN